MSFTTLDNGYAVTQFYYGAVLPNDREYFGGAQDNGTMRGVRWSPNAWFEMLGGDGGAVAVNPINTQILYGEYTYGSIQKSTDGGSNWNDAVAGISDTGFEFIAPFVMDPSAASTRRRPTVSGRAGATSGAPRTARRAGRRPAPRS